MKTNKYILSTILLMGSIISSAQTYYWYENGEEIGSANAYYTPATVWTPKDTPVSVNIVLLIETLLLFMRRAD